MNSTYGLNPRVAALHICERVLVDANTGLWSLIGLYDAVLLPTIPLRLPCYVFCQFTDGRGERKLSFKFMHNGAATASAESVTQFSNPAYTARFFFPFLLHFEDDGLYELECHCGGQLLASCPIMAARCDRVLP